MLAWEQAQLDRVVADLFGFHALQLGWPALQGLRANRMPHRWLLAPGMPAGSSTAVPGVSGAPGVPWVGGQPGSAALRPDASLEPVVPLALRAEFEALPFPAASLDLVVLPHTLECAQDAHQTLREVERVLVPEGRVVLLGFNPASLLGLQQRAAPLCDRLVASPCALPVDGELIGWRRLRDWLRLLGFEPEVGRFGCYGPPLGSDRLLERAAWLEHTGARWWPVLGSVYLLQAVKRVRAMRLVGPAWKRRRAGATAPAIVARRDARRQSGGMPP